MPRLLNATLPACLTEGVALPATGDLLRADVVIAAGRIAAIEPAGGPEPGLDLDGGMVWPCFVDMHTHLDKGHIWPRQPNPDGSFAGALMAVQEDRQARWTPEDVRARMAFSLRCAHAHGTRAIRTHIDSLAPQHERSWPVVAEMRAAWAGRITLQAVSLIPIASWLETAFIRALTAEVTAAGGLFGAVTFMVPELDAGLDRLLEVAAAAGTDIDLHVDETGDPEARSLRHIAEAVLRHRFAGRVTVGHCCSLARQDRAEAERTLDLVAEAGIAVVSLPMCNMYLQDRQAGRTPRWRGVTLLHELKARGVAVAVASDNTRDPFYAYGDLDGMEVFREAVRIGHLDHPLGDWPKAVTTTPARVMGLDQDGALRVGAPADLVLFRARNYAELLSRPQSDRKVVRGGEFIETSLPDYRELDALFGM